VEGDAVIENANEVADRIERRTQRILWASGTLFVAWQLAFFAVYGDGIPTGRRVDSVRAIAFIAWCAALLLLVAKGGGAFRGPEVRELLDDELAQARRAAAYRNGFWAMIIIALIGYAAAHLTAITAIALAHAAMSAGVAVAVATLAYSGRR
jgi:hypothetical protein